MTLTLPTQAPAAGVSSRPGRPRVDSLDTLILDAAVELIDQGEEVTVSKVVERSGVSRAALYRRWPSITRLTAAALDVGRTSYPVVEPGDDLREAITRTFVPSVTHLSISGPGYSISRFHQRLKLIVTDPALQRAYWDSHVAKRRAPLEAALQEAVTAGQLRADLDVPASIDALAGVVYYQLVVRGADISEPATIHRVESALDIIWRGMACER